MPWKMRPKPDPKRQPSPRCLKCISNGKPFFLCLSQVLPAIEIAPPWLLSSAVSFAGLSVSFLSLLDKDLQLPSGFNCNFDFPEEPCGWMYDHAKWLRSTWISSANPNDRTFPGKAAEVSYERWKVSLQGLGPKSLASFRISH